MKFFEKYRWSVIAACLLGIVVIAAVAGGSYSKYKEELQLESSLTVASGALAQSFSIQEHQATQKANGTYEIKNDAAVVTSYPFDYYVAPGVTLPKDPYLTITGKSKVDAYLFVEVVEGTGVAGKTNTSAGLTYALNNQWTKVDGANAKHGGAVYVYTAGTNSAKMIDENFSLGKVEILNNNQVTIGKDVDLATDVSLTFYGYLGQAALGIPAQVFNTTNTGANVLMETTTAVVNEFEPTTASVEVKETFNASTGVKSNVYIKNTGNTSSPIAPAIYVRVKLLAYWYEKDSDHIAGKASWTPTFTPGTDWFKDGDYYYYKKPVAAGAQTTNLISSITLTTDADGNRQVLEILTEAIQADPIDAATAVWPENAVTKLEGIN